MKKVLEQGALIAIVVLLLAAVAWMLWSLPSASAGINQGYQQGREYPAINGVVQWIKMPAPSGGQGPVWCIAYDRDGSMGVGAALSCNWAGDGQ